MKKTVQYLIYAVWVFTVVVLPFMAGGEISDNVLMPVGYVAFFLSTVGAIWIVITTKSLILRIVAILVTLFVLSVFLF